MAGASPTGHLVPFSKSQLEAWREEDRAAGLLPKRGRPRKHYGPREPNGRASRRQADVAADNWSRIPDALWRAVALGEGGLKSRWWMGRYKWDSRSPSPADPLFLNLARRGELDVRSFAKALLWWAGKYPTSNKHLLYRAIYGAAGSRKLLDTSLEKQGSKARRGIASLQLGDEFVGRLDAAIFEDKISDVASLKRDLAAVWQAWCWHCSTVS